MSQGYIATIGFFDGVHIGHRHLLTQLQTAAFARHLTPMVVTFAVHPATVVGRRVPRLLTSAEEKARLLREAGIAHVEILDFTPEIAALSAADFMALHLRDRLGVRCLLVGYDHHFGRPAPDEDFAAYRRYGEALGIEVIAARQYDGGIKVSSTVVRRALGDGDVTLASGLLGRDYTLSGTVVDGQHIGRKMGYPTANLRLADAQRQVPAVGVYLTRAIFPDGTAHFALTNIGHRPTLGEANPLSIESHLLDYTGDLYGTELTLQFLRRVRREVHFANLDTLQLQIGSDVACARRLIADLTSSH